MDGLRKLVCPNAGRVRERMRERENEEERE